MHQMQLDGAGNRSLELSSSPGQAGMAAGPRDLEQRGDLATKWLASCWAYVCSALRLRVRGRSHGDGLQSHIHPKALALLIPDPIRSQQVVETHGRMVLVTRSPDPTLPPWMLDTESQDLDPASLNHVFFDHRPNLVEKIFCMVSAHVVWNPLGNRNQH